MATISFDSPSKDSFETGLPGLRYLMGPTSKATDTSTKSTLSYYSRALPSEDSGLILKGRFLYTGKGNTRKVKWSKSQITYVARGAGAKRGTDWAVNGISLKGSKFLALAKRDKSGRALFDHITSGNDQSWSDIISYAYTGAGDDVLVGYGGELEGGPGADTYVIPFNNLGNSKIINFNGSEGDRIVLAPDNYGEFPANTDLDLSNMRISYWASVDITHIEIPLSNSAFGYVSHSLYGIRESDWGFITGGSPPVRSDM